MVMDLLCLRKSIVIIAIETIIPQMKFVGNGIEHPLPPVGAGLWPFNRRLGALALYGR